MAKFIFIYQDAESFSAKQITAEKVLERILCYLLDKR